MRTMVAAVAALLMAAALMSCTQHQHPTPVDTQEGLEVYLRLSQDGVEWDYMEWRPGVHRYQQYGVADESGAITWGNVVDIDLCIDIFINEEGSKIRWYIRDDAPQECYPPDPEFTAENAT